MKQEIETFLNAIWSNGDVREIRAISYDKKNIIRGYFDNVTSATNEAMKLASSYHVYITLNPTMNELLDRSKNRCSKGENGTKDKEIKELRYLLVDVDVERKTNTSSTDKEKEASFAIANQVVSYLGKPFIFGDSGNGYHLVYKHNAKSANELKEMLQHLHKRFSNDTAKIDISVYNPARISKILGTYAKKGENLPDRPHRQSHIKEVNQASIPLNVQSYIGNMPQTNQTSANQSYQTTFDSLGYVRKIISDKAIDVIQEKTINGNHHFCLGACLFNPEHKKNEASIFVMQDGKICYQCFHQTCKDKTWNQVKNLLNIEKETTCKFCSNPIKWENGIVKPLNLDGSIHICSHKSSKQADEITVDDLEKEDAKKDVELETNKLNPIFESYWKQYENQTESNKEYVLTSFLVSIATSIGNKATLQIGNGIKANMYAMLIGSSSLMKKTTSMNIGLLALEQINKVKKNEYVAKLKAYMEEKEKFDRLEKRDKKVMEAPKEPNDYSYIYSNDFSNEKLFECFISRPDGLFRYSELGSFLALMEKSYMQGLKENLTSWYDGMTSFERKTKSGGFLYAENICPNIVGASTLQWLRKHLDDDDLNSGFLSRFVYVVKREYPNIDVALPGLYQVDNFFVDVLKALSELSETSLYLSNEAIAWYNDFYKITKEAIKQKEITLHSFLDRLLITMHKIAMINHLIDVVQGVAINQNEIGKKSYIEALAWYNFFAGNIESSFQELTIKTNPNELRVLEAIRKHGEKTKGNITIYRSRLMQYSHIKLKELLEILDDLQEKRIASVSDKGKYVVVTIKD